MAGGGRESETTKVGPPSPVSLISVIVAIQERVTHLSSMSEPPSILAVCARLFATVPSEVQAFLSLSLKKLELAKTGVGREGDGRQRKVPKVALPVVRMDKKGLPHQMQYTGSSRIPHRISNKQSFYIIMTYSMAAICKVAVDGSIEG